jgi:hypothetical protein
MSSKITCNQHAVVSHIFENPFCENLSTIQKIGIVVFHILTVGIPLLIYHLVSCCSNSSATPRAEQEIAQEAVSSVQAKTKRSDTAKSQQPAISNRENNTTASPLKQNNNNEKPKEEPPKTLSAPETRKAVDNPLVNKCIELYNQNEDAWVMVPPQTELQMGKQPVIAIGSASFDGAGHFKIHVSVDPSQMEQAIPIVLNILHQEGTPTVGLKFQTKRMLDGNHQVGKEFALHFAADAEQGEEGSHAIGKLLSQIQKAFIEKGINPEKGLVLTAKTREQIEKLPQGEQPLEKRNLEQRKFDRQVPGSAYFYYRHDDFTAIDDSDENLVAEMGSAAERKANKIMLFSEIDQILKKTPENAHNPLGVKDPFRNLRID